MVSSKKKWTVMNPIRRRMKKRDPSSGQNGQLVHWWLLVHSGPSCTGRNSENICSEQWRRLVNETQFTTKIGAKTSLSPITSLCRIIVLSYSFDVLLLLC